MTDNLFVESAIDILVARREQPLEFDDLLALLAEREPALSPLNLHCAAAEGIRQFGEALRAEMDRRADLSPDPLPEEAAQ